MNVGLGNNYNNYYTARQTMNKKNSYQKAKEQKGSINYQKEPKDTYEPSSKSVGKKDEMSVKQNVQLSEKAQQLLKELKEKYSNMDFFIANYETESEAQRYLSQGKKEFSVLIDPELLEKMANDEETRNKYEGILANAGDHIKEIKESIPKDAGEVKSIGISFAEDGTVSYFAVLEKMSKNNKERIERNREKRAEEEKIKEKAKEKEEKENRTNETTNVIKANSIEELIEKLRNITEQKQERQAFDVSL